jgi:hypothetical protein
MRSDVQDNRYEIRLYWHPGTLALTIPTALAKAGLLPTIVVADLERAARKPPLLF